MWGDESPISTDCSGLVYQWLNKAGAKVPRLTADQYFRSRQGTYVAMVDMSDWQPGDVLFFSGKGGKATHAGVYLGNGQMQHASSSKGKVITVTWTYGDKSWYDRHLMGVRRFKR